jgi:hypothetical protein
VPAGDHLQAALAGEEAAQFYRAIQHLWGIGVPRDVGEAEKWFRASAAQGRVNAMANLSVLCLSREPPDYAEAAKWCRMAAERGSASAQRLLGCLFHEGLGVPQDRSEAEGWFLKAAADGDGDAKKALAAFYADPAKPTGCGDEEGFEEEETRLRPIAERGDAEAQRRLGLAFYRRGLEKGVETLTRKVEHGDAMEAYLDAIELGVDAEPPPERDPALDHDPTPDFREAAHWFRLAGLQGDTESQRLLGNMYKAGHGVLQDPDEAARWHGMAAGPSE